MAQQRQECSCGQEEYFPAKVRATVDGFERIISFKTGFICPVPQRHGRSSMGVIFVLRKRLYAVNFVISTGWFPDWDYTIEYGEKQKGGAHLYPNPNDLGYHSPIPRYRGQKPRMEPCMWTGASKCYYSGSGLNAIPLFQTLVSQGEEALWGVLAKYFQETFPDQS